MSGPGDAGRPRVGLFVTCLVDMMRPAVGFAAVRLLEAAGCTVEVPASQTCCGQPGFNSGEQKNSRAIARQVIAAFEEFDHVVAPSGSCAGMIREHYPELLADDHAWHTRALVLAGKTHELTRFLVDVVGLAAVPGIETAFDGKVTYHDSCSGLRELGVKDQPRKLLENVAGLDLVEGELAETCCGFGGLFCVKYPDVSGAMVDRKIDDIEKTGAATVLAGDMGCLLNIAGRLHRRGSSVAARHVAEVLAGMTDEVSPIGAPDTEGSTT
ncbi:MAG: (Fe-S)-binding protein [Rhodospirillales bacterium]